MRRHFRSATKCLAVLCALFSLSWPFALAQPAAAQAEPERALQPTVQGTLVNEAGEPLADVPVYAITNAAGSEWWDAQSSKPKHARTDAKGRFAIKVPFDEVRYEVRVHGPWEHVTDPHVLPEQPKTITFRRETDGDPVSGTLLDADGEPAANVKVNLIGEYGVRSETVTNDRGHFTFDDLPRNIGQAVAIARHDGGVTPLTLIKSQKRKARTLQLVEPVTIVGRVVDARRDAPLGNATVIVAPSFASDFKVRTQSADDGSFTVTGLPPGDYVCYAIADDHYYAPPDGDTFHDQVELSEPGQRGSVGDVTMQPRVTVRGRVIGPDGEPVTDAGVVDPTHRTALTNAEGHFTLRTSGYERGKTLRAFSPRHGYGIVRVDPMQPGERRDDVTVQLNGMARITGRVTDPQGEPIADVNCVVVSPIHASTRTDAHGRFDLGRVALPPKHRPRSIRLRVQPPRPAQPGPERFVYGMDVKRVDGPPERIESYFFHVPRERTLRPLAGERLDLDIKLQPTELLKIEGRVVDAKGEPIEHVYLALFPGNARPDDWARRYSAVSQRWQQTFGSSMGYDTMVEPHPDALLTQWLRDEQGRFTFYVLRSDGEALEKGKPGAVSTRFSLGVSHIETWSLRDDDDDGEGEVRLLGNDVAMGHINLREQSDKESRRRHLIRNITFRPGQSNVRIDVKGTAEGAFEAKDGRPGPEVLIQWQPAKQDQKRDDEPAKDE